MQYLYDRDRDRERERMGACATKPKAEAGDAPAPEPEKEIVSGKEEVVVEEELKKVDGEKDKEIVDDDKRRSLGNLFEVRTPLQFGCTISVISV